MKLKQVESICKREKTIIVITAEGCQWIGAKGCLYPIADLPTLDKSNIFTMFDVALEKRENYYYKELETEEYCFSDIDDGERLVERSGLIILSSGTPLEALITSRGLVFINGSYLKPFAGTENGYEIYERTTDAGQTYFAVKTGFVLLGLIMPMRIVTEEFTAELERWARLCRAFLADQKERMSACAYQLGLLDEAKENN